MKEDFYPPFVAGCFYHIYNRGNNRENLFYKEENYRYFLKKYDEYLSDYLDTYAYCLLPNHFHLLVRVKDNDAVLTAARLSKFLKPSEAEERIPSLEGMVSVDRIVSEQFRRFFISYSQSINKQENRVGSLFQKNFKRKEVKNESYFIRVVHYIHANPQLHGICSDYMEYPHSSYGRILVEKPTKLMKSQILDWFGGKEGYKLFYEINKTSLSVKSGYEIED